MIPEEDYKKIIKLMPTCCVDAIIVKDNKYLLVKRGLEPAKNQWWVIGGRLLKNERVADCAIRKAKEEVGLETEFDKILGVYETMFDKGVFGFPVHTVNTMCLLKYKSGEITLDETSLDSKWMDKIDLVLNPDIRRFLKNVGFEE